MRNSHGRTVLQCGIHMEGRSFHAEFACGIRRRAVLPSDFRMEGPPFHANSAWKRRHKDIHCVNFWALVPIAIDSSRNSGPHGAGPMEFGFRSIPTMVTRSYSSSIDPVSGFSTCFR